MKSPTTWLGLLAMTINAIGLIITGVRYVVRRTKESRKEGKNWSETMADGVKPTTGSVWRDAALLAFLLFGAMAAFIIYGFSLK